jgi:hypothetical protein
MGQIFEPIVSNREKYSFGQISKRLPRKHHETHNLNCKDDEEGCKQGYRGAPGERLKILQLRVRRE